MNLLLYLDKNAFMIPLPDLLNKVKKCNWIKGFEVNIDFSNKEEQNYLKNLALECKKNDLILQVHAHIVDQIIEELTFYHEISSIYGKTLNMINHPIASENIYLAQEKTNILFSKILNYIYDNKFNLTLSIENLNSRANTVRLSKKLLLPILSNNEDLYFTYNIGNELRDYGKITDIDKLFMNRINNVHIYTFDYKEIHKPIVKNDEHINSFIKALSFLKQNNYKGNLVLDYNFSLLGSNADERLNNLLENAKFISEYI